MRELSVAHFCLEGPPPTRRILSSDAWTLGLFVLLIKKHLLLPPVINAGCLAISYYAHEPLASSFLSWDHTDTSTEERQ